MKKILIVLFALLSITLQSQTVVLERIAELEDEDYAIEGTAFLEELSDGSLQLRLSEDYNTLPGPDVRILLNNSVSSVGALEIVNLSDINHFSGAMTFDVPAGVSINDYSHIVFFCVAFNQLWASGSFTDAVPPGGGFVCNTSGVSNSSGANNIDICPSDGISDGLTFANSINALVGVNYAYLITDEFEILQEVVSGSNYDFEGSADITQRVYGVHYDGNLNPAIGSHRSNTSADGCFEHSNSTDYITITKNACPPDFECFNSNVSSGNQTIIDICPSDGINDFIFINNNINENPGEHYAFLITDENEIVQEVLLSSDYNFEGSTLDEQRVYGVHYDGDLIPLFNVNRTLTTATGCFTHSSSTNFLTITKNACPPDFDCLISNVTLNNNQSTADICPSDGSNDNLQFSNSINEDAGENYSFLLTDNNQILLEVIDGDEYNFEGTSDEDQRVYGIHYDGDLNAQIGMIRTATTATECHQHSNNNNFVLITKNACPPEFECFASNVTLANNQSSSDICPTDGSNDLLQFSNSINANTGEHYSYLLTDINEILLEVIDGNEFDFEGTSDEDQRVYGIHFDGVLNAQIGMTRTATTATECHQHSSNSNFVLITKNACPPPFECLNTEITSSNSASELAICPTDGMNDIITLENSQNIEAGDHYAYLITDDNEIVQEMTMSDSYNFEGTTTDIQRVYGIHFDGDLNVQVGQHRDMTTASGCFTHSSAMNFLTITKDVCAPEFECLETLTATTDWATDVEVCPTDGDDDIVELRNNIFTTDPNHYAYLITDENEIVQEMTTDTFYNFEGSPDQTQRVYGIHFDGALDVKIGEHREMTTASGCFTHSGGNLFLTITKGNCAAVFECLETLTATTDWVTDVEICPTDGEDDILELRNNLFITDPNHYAYLITDEDQLVQEMTSDTFYNFEGSPDQTQRVYGIHFDGVLDVKIGEHREMTTASGCFTHSGGNLFLSITKGSCPPVFECLETLTATTDWATEVNICPTDGEDDILELRNNVGIEAGTHYAYLITDANENVLDMTMDTFYNFEGSALIEERVYGIHFDGTLDLKIGEHRMETTASGCFTHSGANLFLTINKSACETTFECVESLTASFAWATQIDICSTDGEDDEILIQNNIDTPPGEHYAFLMTDTNQVVLEVLFDSIYNFEGTGTGDVRIYGVSYSGQLDVQIGEDRKSTTATGCFIHSGDFLFLTVSRSALCVTSTEEILASDVFSVSPNPSNGSFQLEILGQPNLLRSEVLTLDGSLVKNITNQSRFDLDQSGVYLLRVITDQGQFISKIVKM